MIRKHGFVLAALMAPELSSVGAELFLNLLLMHSCRYLFITITDNHFFPGTLATVNSILHYHPDAEICIVENEKKTLSQTQRDCFAGSPNVRMIGSSQFDNGERHIDAWELKAYAAHDLSRGYDVIIGIDSDCLLCSEIGEEIQLCQAQGVFMGGQDGSGCDYDSPYETYGIVAPQQSAKYMSTSLYLCAMTEENIATLKRWGECCSKAEFNGQGSYPGHGDQGVLNAILFAEDQSSRVILLDNQVWSQHWVYWRSTIGFLDDQFINITSQSAQQRSIHCGGAEKFWSASHRNKVLESHSLQTYPYVWFLAMLWFGPCGNWNTDPIEYLPSESVHLLDDLLLFLTQIFQVYPRSQLKWNNLTDIMLERMTAGVHRFLSLGGGSMTEIIELIAGNPQIRRYTEIGSYLGGSLLTLAIRFANRDISFTGVESFMGNFDGTMDGCKLPSRKELISNLSKFPALNTHFVAGESRLAVNLLADKSIDFLLIDGCHDTDAVLNDIDLWLPKISNSGIIAGDDYGWESVGRAVRQRFGATVSVTASGNIWWVQR